jgi:hypothetical protein
MLTDPELADIMGWSVRFMDRSPIGDPDGLAQRVRRVAQAAAQAERAVLQVTPAAWISVANAMPKPGVNVLACYRNRLGKLRRIRAHWIAAKTVEANTEDWDQCSEYDEATDTYYVAEGWFECIDNWGDYSAVAVSEGDVKHWMPLPEAPQEPEA